MLAEEPLEGSLTATPLPALLTTAATEGVTGTLIVDGKGEVWFDRGRVYLASTPTGPDLSTVLADPFIGGEGTPPPNIATLGQQSLDDLVAERPDAEEGLRRLLHEHNLNALFELLVVTDAPYRFAPAAAHPIGPRFAEDTVELTTKARQRLEIWRRIAVKIPNTSAVFTLSPSLPTEVGERVVTADEWRFLSRLDGTNTVADIINQTGESAFRVCSALYRLLLEELIEEAA